MRKLSKTTLRNNISGYLFILPSFAFLVLFAIWPIFQAFGLSLTNFNGFTTPDFVGLRNFVRLLQDKDVQKALENTALFVLINVPIQIVLCLFLAALLSMRFQNRLGRFVRGVAYIPVICSATLAGTIFYYIFASNAESILNQLLALFNIPKVAPLTQSTPALLCVCFVTIWKNMGYYLVILYAGMMDVSRTLYEASEIDGATRLKQFFYITLPCIKPVLYTVVTLCTIASFQTFDIAYAMTSGGPGNATTSLAYEIYTNAFSRGRYGYSCAIGVILFFLVLVVTLIQRKLLAEKVGADD